jgi:hypothetical protein
MIFRQLDNTYEPNAPLMFTVQTNYSLMENAPIT